MYIYKKEIWMDNFLTDISYNVFIYLFEAENKHSIFMLYSYFDLFFIHAASKIKRELQKTNVQNLKKNKQVCINDIKTLFFHEVFKFVVKII